MGIRAVLHEIGRGGGRREDRGGGIGIGGSAWMVWSYRNATNLESSLKGTRLEDLLLVRPFLVLGGAGGAMYGTACGVTPNIVADWVLLCPLSCVVSKEYNPFASAMI